MNDFILDFNCINMPLLKVGDFANDCIYVKPPTKGLIDKMRANFDNLQSVLQNFDENSVQALYTLAAELISFNINSVSVTAEQLSWNIDDLIYFFTIYDNYIDSLENAENLILPIYPISTSESQESENINDYTRDTTYEKMVSDYTGLNFLEIDNLEYIRYLAYRRDAFIYTLNRTEGGREYLDNAWRLGQTKPDRQKLREEFKK